MLMRCGSFVADPDDRGEQGGFPFCLARAVSVRPEYGRVGRMMANSGAGPLPTMSCAV